MANMIIASNKTQITSPPTPKSTLCLLPPHFHNQDPQFSLSITPKTLTSAAALAAATPLPSLPEEFEKAQLFYFDLTLPTIAAEFLFLMFTLDKLHYSLLGTSWTKEMLRLSVKDTSTKVKQLEEQAVVVMRAARAEISAALNKMKKETTTVVDAKLAEGRKVEAELQRHWRS
ncbi:hypothetical protein L1987_85703 [Smallanthus sonchifolius]|uniref:Uncharacterized protein n=1 Tax=Smallanthus sonchifolius TaxID=185202 RepID=A0ACB8XWL5_9ASTR|nr:hypothetical protein L1987_85703 [Smallanthus sonchifolius]